MLAFVLLLGWLCGVWVLWRIPRLRSLDPASDPVHLSVIIPARDEEKRLPALLDSLKLQTHPPWEVIVVDDHSSDRTAQIARLAGCTVIQVSQPPRGWLGKPWACAAGAAAASGSHLLFLDADTRLEPAGLGKLTADLSDGAQVISVQPYHHVVRAFEQLSAFFNIIQMAGMGTFSPLPRQTASGLFGPCLLMKQSAYQSVGGHASVRGEVLDDVRLGQRLCRAGLAARLYGGRGVISFRMYPDGLGQLIEGWSKNFSAGAAAVPLAALIPLLVWIQACLLGALLPFLLRAKGTLPHAEIYSVLFYTACAAQIYWMLRRLGSYHPLTAALFPIPLAFFVAVFVRSFILTYVLGAVRWKGRTIRTRPPR